MPDWMLVYQYLSHYHVETPSSPAGKTNAYWSTNSGKFVLVFIKLLICGDVMISCKVSTVHASFRPAKIGCWKTYRRGDKAINFFQVT